MAQTQPSDPSAAKDIKDTGDIPTGNPEERPTPERRGSAFKKFFASILGSKNPISHPADPQTNTVWLLDNTAFQPVPEPGASPVEQDTPWQAEFVACIFDSEARKDVGQFIATIADHVGLDGETGIADEETHQRITARVQPFLDMVSPGRTITMDLDIEGDGTQSHQLGPSDRNGIISQTVQLGAPHVPDGTSIQPRVSGFSNPAAQMKTLFAAPEGWLIVSDIDDTIKRTMTMDTTGILRTTFTEVPTPIAGMPEFYRHVHEELNPAWFYLSASPYNLYRFLHGFLHEYYVPGTLLLRDYSWMDVNGLIKSLTEGTQEYKSERMEKIRGWFPRRRVLCIGDSTQRDPETYAEMYRRYPEWIHAIAIRKVTDVSGMEERNKNERFEEAFKGVPDDAWTVFEDPIELYGFVDQLGMEDQDL